MYQSKDIYKHRKFLHTIDIPCRQLHSLLSLKIWMTYNGFIIFFPCLLVLSNGSVDLRTLKGKDTYAEELLIKRLKSGHLLVQFRFVITSDAKSGVFVLCFSTD